MSEAEGGEVMQRTGSIRMVGHRWAPESHTIRDFLARNHVEYRWLDAAGDREGQRLLQELAESERRFPILFFPDGSRLVAPSDKEVARKLGLDTEADSRFYDLIIVGGGPAGLAAAVYGSSEGLRVLVAERDVPGGQAGMSASIENYLGFPDGISGAELGQRAIAQAQRFGAEILSATEVKRLYKRGSYPCAELDDGTVLRSHVALITTGVSYRRLEVPGSAELTGAGIYYGAATAEAATCADHDVYLVGGGNSSGQAAVLLSHYARNVNIVTTDESLEQSMSRYLVDRIEAAENIHVLPQSEVVKVEGEGRLEAVYVRRGGGGEVERRPTTRLFVWIGGSPRTEWLTDAIACDEEGYVLAGPDLRRNGALPEAWPLERDPFLLETSLPGIFVAGDARAGAVKRVASAVGEGSMAIQFVHRYLRDR